MSCISPPCAINCADLSLRLRQRLCLASARRACGLYWKPQLQLRPCARFEQRTAYVRRVRVLDRTGSTSRRSSSACETAAVSCISPPREAFGPFLASALEAPLVPRRVRMRARSLGYTLAAASESRVVVLAFPHPTCCGAAPSYARH